MSNYDAVVIGSGIGGLACGAFLADTGMRVLVLEKHTKIGGYAHNFKRRGFTFESGIHSVPMGPDGIMFDMLRKLGVADGLEPIELPEMYDALCPNYRFTMPSSKDEIHRTLFDSFPDQREGLERLFGDFAHFERFLIQPLAQLGDTFTEEDRDFVSRFHNRSYKDYISEFFSDSRARDAFFLQWPYGGISADRGAALFHVMMYYLHYRDGTYGLRGGFSRLAEALASAITRNGGAVLTRREVTSVETGENRVRAVHTKQGESFETDLVVSNISPYVLFGDLLDEAGKNRLWSRRLSNLSPSVSAVVVYLGMKPSSMDALRHTTFWFEDRDSHRIYERIQANDKEHLDHLVLLKNDNDPDHPTLTLLNFTEASLSNDWGKDKMVLGEKMLSLAEQIVPGIKKDIQVMEVGSPRTFERYTANTDGALYGFENTKTLYGEAKMPSNTHLTNLFQTGHWGKPGGGVWNVMVNAYYTFHRILRRG